LRICARGLDNDFFFWLGALIMFFFLLGALIMMGWGLVNIIFGFHASFLHGACGAVRLSPSLPPCLSISPAPPLSLSLSLSPLPPPLPPLSSMSLYISISISMYIPTSNYLSVCPSFRLRRLRRGAHTHFLVFRCRYYLLQLCFGYGHELP
jgi:hypothetical protein